VTGQFKLNFNPTDRGFLRADFQDRQGGVCSIQESSLATDVYIRLGKNEGAHDEATGECLARMRLNHEHARELGRVLTRFAESGSLAESFAISESNLQEIMPKLAKEKRDLYLPFLNKAMEIYEINTPLRAAAFLAQIAHESDELKYFEEIWGPTQAQKRYEGRSDLGNTELGDGYRFRGRGPIQLTGRSNYKKYGDLLGVDFVSNPDLAARPEFAFQTAALYWESHGLNDLADAKDFITITKRINGGLNGLADRQRYCEVAKKALGLAL
jgi:putative chitinase